ncbi:MAG: phytase [Bacteroidota bacterium]|nr:phytase [Bacteroidota bacterium]
MLRNISLATLIIVIFITGCKDPKDKSVPTIKKYSESLDSSGFSVYLRKAIKNQQIFALTLTPDEETEPVNAEKGVDAADDPAIWINENNPEKSLILGTNKESGLHVYDLQGNELQFLNVGCLNNVDLRDGFLVNNKEVVLVAASNCTLNTISLFFIDKNTRIVSDKVLNIKSSVNDVYGLCMYKNPQRNKYYVFVNGKGAEVEQWEIFNDSDSLNARLVREFSVNSKPEGMVADDENGLLFIGIEEEGIIKLNAEPDSEYEPEWVTDSSPKENKYISSDIEGLALYKTNDKTYLLASSQGNFSFALFEVSKSVRYLFSFTVKDGMIDGVEETDGVEVINFPVNENYPEGLLVVHDGFNFQNDSIQAQNFKYISWEKISKLIEQYNGKIK